MSDEFKASAAPSGAGLGRHIRLDKIPRRPDSVGASLRLAFDDDDAESEPVPDEMSALLQLLH